MSETIFLPTQHYYVLMLVFILITSFYVYKMQNIDFKLGLNKNMDNLATQFTVLDDVPLINNNLKSNLMYPDLEKRQALLVRDKEAIYNEFKAPEKRLPEHAYPDRYVRSLINVPTRGLPDNYQATGVLVRKEDEKILQLFGRQTYPSSNQWEYYVSGADSYGFPNKMPIKVKGDREIENGQEIEVPFLDVAKGIFKANIYNYDVPRYNPYDY